MMAFMESGEGQERAWKELSQSEQWGAQQGPQPHTWVQHTAFTEGVRELCHKGHILSRSQTPDLGADCNNTHAAHTQG